MPRSGVLGTYSLPPGTVPQQPNTTIESADWNGLAGDVQQTFNTPTPISYGGTDASNAADARANLGVSSAAVSAMDNRRNRIVNGSMDASQENGNSLGTTNGYYPADQFFLAFTTTGAGRSIQRIQVRTLSGSVNQLEYRCTTAKVSLAAGDREIISQNLEGSNVADCAFGTASAKPFAHRFQVQLPAGTYHMHYANSAANRHCAVPFVISMSEANMPVVKTVVVPADTGGTWLTSDGVIGLTCDLVLAAGSTFTGGSPSTWSGSTFYAASTQFNILSSTSNVARFADVGMKLDPEATGVYGQYDSGDVGAVYRIERYAQISGAASGYSIDTNTITGVFNIPVSMAKSPTPYLINGTAKIVNPGVAFYNIASIFGVTYSGKDSLIIEVTSATSTTPAKFHEFIGEAFIFLARLS